MHDISDIKQYIAKYEKADSKELVDEGKQSIFAVLRMT